MNILVLGRPHSGAVAIAQGVREALAGETTFLDAPDTVEPFLQAPATEHTLVRIDFERWTDNRLELSKILSNAQPLQFDKRILIRRDPRDEMIHQLRQAPRVLGALADQVRLSAWVGVLREKERIPENVSFLRLCELFDALFHANLTERLSSFSAFDNGYFRFSQAPGADNIIFKYEDFARGETAALSDYLKLAIKTPAEPEDRPGAWKRCFSKDDLEYFKRYKREFSLQGYDDWELSPVEHLEEEELTGPAQALLEQCTTDL